MADEKVEEKPLTKLQAAAEMLALQARVVALEAALNSYNESIQEIVRTFGKENRPDIPDSSKWVTKGAYDMLNGSYHELRSLNDKFIVDISTLQKKLRTAENSLEFERAERMRLEILLGQTPSKSKKRSSTKK